jgi:hypothetical protein
MTTFRRVHRGHDTFDASLKLWSIAEQTATDHGVRMAAAAGKKPTEIQAIWFDLTQVYRSTLRRPGHRAVANVVLPDFDVRDAEASYKGVNLAWAAALGLWGQQRDRTRGRPARF